MFELTVKVSNEESALRKRFAVFEPIYLTKDDSKLQEFVNATIKEFQGNVEDVILSIKMVW